MVHLLRVDPGWRFTGESAAVAPDRLTDDQSADPRASYQELAACIRPARWGGQEVVLMSGPPHAAPILLFLPDFVRPVIAGTTASPAAVHMLSTALARACLTVSTVTLAYTPVTLR